MNNVVINLSDYGTDLSSRTIGSTVRNLILSALHNSSDAVLVSCQDIRTLSESFADEVFGILVAEKGKPWFKEHVSIIGLNENTRSAILRAVAERLSLQAAD